jgi:hypothetical protein
MDRIKEKTPEEVDENGGESNISLVRTSICI